MITDLYAVRQLSVDRTVSLEPIPLRPPNAGEVEQGIGAEQAMLLDRWPVGSLSEVEYVSRQFHVIGRGWPSYPLP